MLIIGTLIVTAVAAYNAKTIYKETVDFMVSKKQRENMTFGTTLSDKPPSGTSSCPPGKPVRLGVFFDGTDNNAWRDWGKGFADWKPNRKENDPANPDDGSPKKPRAIPGQKEGYDELNGPTNVAKLYFLFIEEGCCKKRIYTTGVGGGDNTTVTGQMYKIEAASGLGGRARIDWGIIRVTEFVNQHNHHMAVEKRIATFGFSRGATQARDFLNKVRDARIKNKHLPPTGYQWVPIGPLVQYSPNYPPEPQYVQVPTYPEMRGILFEYLGIMDTVASEGLGTIASVGDSIAGYNLAVLGRPKKKDQTPEKVLESESTYENVQDKEGWVHRTFHQVADDEYRDVFALEVIGNDPKKNGWWTKYKHLPKNMREVGYPGCHADIGGGYRNSTYPVKDKSGQETNVPLLINIATLTLRHMVEDTNMVTTGDRKVNVAKGAIPLFSDPGSLPKELGMLDAGVPKGASNIDELYEKYCAKRLALINKYASKYPLFADWTHDKQYASCYLQSYPDSVYQAIAKELHEDDTYKKLLQNYIHISENTDIYKYGTNPLRRVLRSPFSVRDMKYGLAVGVAAGSLLSTGSVAHAALALNTLTTRRQRDVHYHGFQNSYDEENCPNK